MTTLYSDATLQQMQFLLPALVTEEAAFIFIIIFSEDYRSHTNTVGPNTHSLYIGTMGHLSSCCSLSSLSMALQRFVGCFPQWLGIVMGALTKCGTLLDPTHSLSTYCMYALQYVPVINVLIFLARSQPTQEYNPAPTVSAVHQSHSWKGDLEPLEVLTLDMRVVSAIYWVSQTFWNEGNNKKSLSLIIVVLPPY